MSRQGSLKVCLYDPKHRTSVKATIEISSEFGYRRDVVNALDNWFCEVKSQLEQEFSNIFSNHVEQYLDSWIKNADPPTVSIPQPPAQQHTLPYAIDHLFFQDTLVLLDDDKPEIMLNALTLAAGPTHEVESGAPEHIHTMQTGDCE